MHVNFHFQSWHVLGLGLNCDGVSLNEEKVYIGAGLSVLRYCAKFLYFELGNGDVDSYIYSRFLK